MRTLRALPTIFRVGIAAAIAYRSEFVVWALTTNIPLIMLALWIEVAREGPLPRAGGVAFGEKELVAYFLATLIVRQLTGNWVVWEMNTDIREGNLARLLLRPIHPFVTYTVDGLASVPMRVLLSIPIAIVALFWVGGGHVATDAARWTIALLGIAGAWGVVFSAMLIIGTLGLYWESSIAVFDLWLGFFFVFSGYLMPLGFFPGWLRALSWWLPFRYTLAFPVETMLGMESVGQALRSLAVQWAYVAAFTGLGLALWKRGLARYAAFGG